MTAIGEGVVATALPDKFKNILVAKGYMPQYVFNADERLVSKCMVSRTYISKEEKTAPDFMATKNRLMLLLYGKAEGDFKCKPLLVYHSQNLRTLKCRSMP